MRLVRISLFFFEFNLFICYKFDKLNIVLDALFRLAIIDKILTNKIDVLETLYNLFIIFDIKNLAIKVLLLLTKQIETYYIILIKLANNFK